MKDIDKAFNPETKSIYFYYYSDDVGFYIPLYQRKYSWDRDNIDQLIEDLSTGVGDLVEDEEDEIRFLGTIITVTETNKSEIEPQDPTGLPRFIEKVIDGQQRLSTIALFSTQLYKHILEIQKKIPKNSEYFEEIEEVCDYWKDRLKNIFSLDLRRGTPRRKPKIIRGNEDFWTKDGRIIESYKSPIAKYLSEFIQFTELDEKLPKMGNSNRVSQNLKRIDSWLKKSVIVAHDNPKEFLLSGKIIINKINQEYIWQFDRDNLKEIVLKVDCNEKRSLNYYLCSLVQLFSVSHYLLDRCCFTIIQPSNDNWAFDMFQSLNATGTPLTALETFKPLVFNITQKEEERVKRTDNEINFKRIDKLFAGTTRASQKSKLANDFLASFRIVIDGQKLQSHFSKQKKWLDKTFEGLQGYQSQKIFIKFLADYAEFYKDVWIDYDGTKYSYVDKIAHHEESELASLLILYLKDSSHKMSITVPRFSI